MIHNFVRGIMKEAGLDTLGKQFFDDYAAKLVVQVERHIGNQALAMLDHQGKVEYIKYMEKIGDSTPDPDDMLSFFRNHIADFDKKMANVLNDFRLNFLASMKRD